ANRLQRAKLLEVFYREDVEGLPGDHRAHNEGNADGNAEVDRNARILDVIAHRLPGEIDAGDGPQAGVRLNTRTQRMDGDARLGFHQHERELVALAADELDRLAVP